MKTIIFEGKITIGGQLVDVRIYKECDENGVLMYYSYEINPEVKSADQADFHCGKIQRAEDLETLLFRIKMFQDEIKQVDKMRFNTNY